MNRPLRAAVVSWFCDPVSHWAIFEARVREAVLRAEADLVVLPELFSLELLGGREYKENEVPAVLALFWEPIVGVFVDAARETGSVVVAGSHFQQVGQAIRNVCPIALPTGEVRLQPKVKRTTYERSVWGVSPGAGLTRLPDARIGVTVCYDVEFPEAGRALAEDGTLVHAVPAYTETRQGFQRVRWSCLARAIENQVFVLHASLRGSLGREPLVSTYGSSAILAPSIEPFPESAVLAETDAPTGHIAIARAILDFEALTEARENGPVRNWHDRDAGDWGRV